MNFRLTQCYHPRRSTQAVPVCFRNSMLQFYHCYSPLQVASLRQHMLRSGHTCRCSRDRRRSATRTLHRCSDDTPDLRPCTHFYVLLDTYVHGRCNLQCAMRAVATTQLTRRTWRCLSVEYRQMCNVKILWTCVQTASELAILFMAQCSG